MALSNKELERIAVAGVEQQVEGVETIYQALMSHVAILGTQLRSKAAELDGRRHEVQAMP
jgi:uncharacterized protein YoxC